jgi:hypothetical protein
VTDVNGLYELSQLTLTTAVACIATTDSGAPDLQYVSPAQPAFDCCPAVIVHVAALGEENTSPLSATDTGHRASFGRINLASVVISALRCAPVVQKDGSVLTANIQAVAKEVQQDAWALWCGFYHAIKNGTFLGICEDVHFDNRGLSIREQGGCVGWQFTLRAELGGIPNPGPGS